MIRIGKFRSAVMLAAALIGLALVKPVQAAELVIEAGTGRVLALGGNATSVFAADPKVAEVRPASLTSLFVFGVAPGRTTVAAMDASGKPIAEYQVTVRPSSYAASEAQRGFAKAAPGQHVQALPSGNGIALTGQVGNANEASRAVEIARGLLAQGQSVDNRLAVRSSVQVNLRVRIAEMSRTLTRGFGINWSAAGDVGRYSVDIATGNLLTAVTNVANHFAASAKGSPNVNAMIDALSQDQLVHVLAEPNLTAMSGETASFLAGGEYPIPVGQQNGTVTIEFKQYGISLAFVPTVMENGRISLHVRPEVSQLTDQGAITLNSGNQAIQIPALSVRRADTTVELGSGQSFAIAGLLSDHTTTTGNALPFAGDVPILGALFRSDNFLRNETELVILVTPYIVTPVSSPVALRAPTDGWRAPNDLERILLLRQTGHGGPWDKAKPGSIPGEAGFIVQ